MRKNLRSVALPLVLLTTLTFSGCVTSNKDTPRAVSIPADCESLAAPVALPPVKKGDDARAQVARQRAAAASANRRLKAVKDCQEAQRLSFGRAR